ncbi:MAG TPA: zinc ribbon domain-containing protein [Pyrinomonadaceae bacterium]|jgi:predicted amidophosphoribosyltransferase|nr:zinc ribbon domain-containing protein [Pyrinomonadaceae bacterium]
MLNPVGFSIGVLELLIILVFIAVVALIVWLVVWLVKRSGAGGSKKCPHCAETIKVAARVCRFCGREV